MDTDEMRETWLNGNRKEIADWLIKKGKLSWAIEFAMALPNDAERRVLMVMLGNREIS